MPPINQHDTQEGLRVLLANADLSSKENYLVEIVNNSGAAEFGLPDAVTDSALFVIDDGDTAGLNVSALPLTPNRNYRIKLKGSATVGGLVALADPAVAADKGKVRALPSTAGTYTVVGVFESAGSDGDLVLVRACPQIRVIVAGSHIADPAATASDPDAITASAPAAAAALTTDLTGVDTGTDMTAAQAAQIVADLAALKAGIDANNAEIDALITDLTSVRTQLVAAIDDIQANNGAIDSALAAIETAGIVATS